MLLLTGRMLPSVEDQYIHRKIEDFNFTHHVWQECLAMRARLALKMTLVERSGKRRKTQGTVSIMETGKLLHIRRVPTLNQVKNNAI